MQRNTKIDLIQYPIINEQEFTIQGNSIIYPKTNFYEKSLIIDSGYSYYLRSDERKIYHYLCNNLLYRTNFFVKHWNYFESTYTNHNDAEASIPNNKIFRIFFDRTYFRNIGSWIFRCYEKIYHSSEIIKNIVITQTMAQARIIHIGYYSTETKKDFSAVRGVSRNNHEGISTVLNNLTVFSDINFLAKAKFKEDIKSKISS